MNPWISFVVISYLGNSLVLSNAETEFKQEHLSSLPRVKRVIGGHSVEAGQWPWMVHLTGKVPKRTFWGIPLSYTNFYCGGSLLNEEWVMTAAHCFTGDGIPSYRMLTPKYWHAKVGEVESQQSVATRFWGWVGRTVGQGDWAIWKVHATKIFLHPQYNPDNFWLHDIALLKLEKKVPVEEDPNIAPVQLSPVTSGYPPAGQVCIMKGWGCTQAGGPQSDLAQAVELPIVHIEQCSNLYGANLGDTRLCAGYNLQGKGICKGDSGGPLVCRRSEDGPWIQEGLASFTSSQDSGSYPGVFTKTSVYLPWIREIMGNN